MIKSYKYRIYPNKSQKELIEKHFGCVRWVYNWGLERKIKIYEGSKKNIGCFDLMKELTQLKKQEEYQWSNEVNSQSLQMALRNLDNAFNAFFKKNSKFPKFKSKKDNKKSFQIPQGLRIDTKLSIPKIPNIKIKVDKELEGKIKTATINKTQTNKYFVSIVVENDIEFPNKPEINEDTMIGIDLGIKNFATISDGRKIENHKYLKRSLGKLKKQQRGLSRKKKGSKNRDKQRLVVARLYEKITNQRNDFLHKLTYQLTHENQMSIAIEDLSVKNMLQNSNLSREISDASWGEFRRQLEYKCDWYGKNLLVIGRFEPSSKFCNVCGNINNELRLIDREWVCIKCNTKHDRDILAAQNIKQFALIKNRVGQTRINACGEQR